MLALAASSARSPPDPMTSLRSLAHGTSPLPPSTTTAEVEARFRAEPARRSVVVARAGTTPVVIGRARLFGLLAGSRGEGPRPAPGAPASGLPVADDRTFAGAVDVSEVAATLLGSGTLDPDADLLVHLGGPTAPWGTASVADVLHHLARALGDRAEEERRLGHRFAALIANSSEVILAVDADWSITWASPSTRAVRGLDPADLLGSHVLENVHPDDVALAADVFAEVMARPGHRMGGEVRVDDGIGGWTALEYVVANLLDDHDVGAVVVNFFDVTPRRQLEDRLRHDATHDALTGLPNRQRFVDLLASALADDAGGEVAIAFLDLDGFKAVNDSLGHPTGDRLLHRVAAALAAAVPDGVTVARLGGDEFGLLVRSPQGDAATVLADLARRCCRAVEVPFTVDGHAVRIAASIGVAGSERATTSVEELLRRADVAMYAAKGQGRGRVETWEPVMHEHLLDRHRMAAELQVAAGAGQLRVVYQPVVSTETGAPLAFEALLRWDRPGVGVVSPDVFVPIAEECGAIVDIGRWVLHRACRDAVSWSRHPAAPAVAVNLSARQLGIADVVADVEEALAVSGLPPHRLELEITESTVMEEPQRCREQLGVLRGLGVRVALDDFGTGHSSLGQLRRLALDCVKVDRSFVAGLPDDPADVALVEGIVRLADALGLSVVAEGIESAEQAAVVADLGIERAQGYLFSRPVGSDDVARSLGAVPGAAAHGR